MLESELQKQAMEYLARAVPGGFFFRVERKGRQLYGAHSATTPGTPDILGCVQGRFVGIELKAKWGVMSDSQEAFRGRVEAVGGLYYMVKTLKELEQVVAEARGAKP